MKTYTVTIFKPNGERIKHTVKSHSIAYIDMVKLNPQNYCVEVNQISKKY